MNAEVVAKIVSAVFEDDEEALRAALTALLPSVGIAKLAAMIAVSERAQQDAAKAMSAQIDALRVQLVAAEHARDDALGRAQ